MLFYYAVAVNKMCSLFVTSLFSTFCWLTLNPLFITNKQDTMKEINYILLFDDDLITSSILTVSLYKEQPESNIYKASSTRQALDILDMLCRPEKRIFEQEICFIVDLNMKASEGFVFLTSLASKSIEQPVRAYVISDYTERATVKPDSTKYQLSGSIIKPLDLEAIEQIIHNPLPNYFQKHEKPSLLLTSTAC